MCSKTLVSNSVQFASTLAHCSDHVLQVKKQNDSTTSLKKWHRRVFQTMYDSRHWYYSCCFSPQNNFHPTPWWVLNSVVDTIVPVQSNERRSRNWNSRAGQSFHLIMKLWTSIHIKYNLQLIYEFFLVMGQITHWGINFGLIISGLKTLFYRMILLLTSQAGSTTRQ